MEAIQLPTRDASLANAMLEAGLVPAEALSAMVSEGREPRAADLQRLVEAQTGRCRRAGGIPGRTLPTSAPGSR